MKARVAWIAAALLLVSTACSPPLPPPTNTSSSTAECDSGESRVILSEDNNGERIILNRGDSLAVALTSNPSTGYEWTLEAIDTTLLRPDGTSYSGSDIPGDAGTEIFCFTALRAGTSTLTLHYHQPFAKGVPPLETFEVIVEIKD